MTEKELEYHDAHAALARMLDMGCYSDEELAYAKRRLARARKALLGGG